MATRYLRSTDGSNSDDGSTWALAKATLAGTNSIDSVDTAGDTIWVSQSHAESTAGAITYSCAGTVASPTKLLCGNDAAEPPTSLSTTASVTTTSGDLRLNGSFYAYGIKFKVSHGVYMSSGSAESQQFYQSCILETTAPGSSGVIYFGGENNAATRITTNGCTFTFANSNNRVQISAAVEIVGGTMTGTSPSSIFRFASDRTHGRLLCTGMDFSSLSSSVNLAAAGTISDGVMIFRNCKLPSSWSGALVSGTITPGQRYEMHNCDASDTNYRIIVMDNAGTLTSETTIVRSSGASDGTTSLAWKIVTTGSAEYPTILFYSPEIVKWNDTTGSSLTATVEIVTDGVTLKDDEIWLELTHLGTSGFPISTTLSDAKADVIATAADQTTSSVTWTTTGLSSPVKQKLSVSFTPQEKGYVIGRVVVCKASTTVYIDPMMSIA